MSRTTRLLGCALVGALLLLAAPMAGADADDAHTEHEMKAEAKDKAHEKAAKGKEHAKHAKDHAKGKADKARERAEGHPGPAEIADEHAEHAKGDGAASDGAASDGAAMSDDMKARRDERKAIKADYDEAVEGGADRIQGKKPWWKFWGAE